VRYLEDVVPLEAHANILLTNLNGARERGDAKNGCQVVAQGSIGIVSVYMHHNYSQFSVSELSKIILCYCTIINYQR